MASIAEPVGRNGENLSSDVQIIQSLLNQNRHLLQPLELLPESGNVDAQTITAIETFQSRVVVGLSTPDGKVDPGGQTLAKLNANARTDDFVPDFIFPLLNPPLDSFRTGGRAFRSRRSNGRRHAGCDLLQNRGADVIAMEDGVITVGLYDFYQSTKAFEVNHGGFIVRYCEVSSFAPGISVGTPVNKGDVLAFVGQLNSGASMLHLEMYSGTRSGGLTNRNNLPFQRRTDLINPSSFLDNAPIGGEDNVGQGRVLPTLRSGLNLRSKATVSAITLRSLSPGTNVKIIKQVDGSAYSPGDRTDWYQVQVDGQVGFVAAFFIDRL